MLALRHQRVAAASKPLRTKLKLQPELQWKTLVTWLTETERHSPNQANSGILGVQPGKTGRIGTLTGMVRLVTLHLQTNSGRITLGAAWAARPLGMSTYGP